MRDLNQVGFANTLMVFKIINQFSFHPSRTEDLLKVTVKSILVMSKIKYGVQKLHPKLILEDHLLMVLIKLRFGLCDRDLAYRFRVSKTTVSNIVRPRLPLMAVNNDYF